MVHAQSLKNKSEKPQRNRLYIPNRTHGNSTQWTRITSRHSKQETKHSTALTVACRQVQPGDDEGELKGGGGGVLGARGRLAAAGLGAASAEHASAVPACGGGHEQLPVGEGVRCAAGAEARHHGRPQEADQELVRARRVQLLRRVLRAGARRPLPAHGGWRGPQPRRPRRHAP